MIKIKLFSTWKSKGIEGSEAELYLNFYLVLNKNYGFTFLIDSPNLSCSDRHPIKLWKHFLMEFEEEYVKYLRRYEVMVNDRTKVIPREKTKEDIQKGAFDFLASELE